MDKAERSVRHCFSSDSQTNDLEEHRGCWMRCYSMMLKVSSTKKSWCHTTSVYSLETMFE